jgi:hypothetical protein
MSPETNPSFHGRRFIVRYLCSRLDFGDLLDLFGRIAEDGARELADALHAVLSFHDPNYRRRFATDVLDACGKKLTALGQSIDHISRAGGDQVYLIDLTAAQKMVDGLLGYAEELDRATRLAFANAHQYGRDSFLERMLGMIWETAAAKAPYR